MTREQYLEQRKELLAAVEALLIENKLEESNAKMADVKDLDAKWEQIKLANANFNALKDVDVGVVLENKGVAPKEGMTEMDKMQDQVPEPAALSYEKVWARHIQGKTLAVDEQDLLNKVNLEHNNAYTHTVTGIPTLVPETVVAGIWSRAVEMYPLLGDVKKYNVRGNLTLNKHTGITEGDAAWYSESTATADEKNTFGQLNLTGCELAKAITVSWKMRAMSVEEFIPFIQNELAERIGVAMGVAVARGKGKPAASESTPWPEEPLGVETVLLAESNTPQVVTYNPDASTPVPLTYEKLTEAISKIHSSYLSGAAIYANNATIWTQLANLVDTNKRALFIPDLTSGGVGRMFGMVVKADAGISANSILIGHANKGYVLNTNEPLSLASQENVKARTVDYAAYTIADGGVLDAQAFALIKKSS